MLFYQTDHLSHYQSTNQNRHIQWNWSQVRFHTDPSRFTHCQLTDGSNLMLYFRKHDSFNCKIFIQTCSLKYAKSRDEKRYDFKLKNILRSFWKLYKWRRKLTIRNILVESVCERYFTHSGGSWRRKLTKNIDNIQS